MRTSRAVLENCGLHAAAAGVTSNPMDRLPLLATDRCLADAPAAVRSSAISNFATGTGVESETLTMPRSGFGPRPINIIETSARAVYDALTEQIRPSLPGETRSRENWDRFAAVGVFAPSDTYVVELDIASCYEYIEHDRLRQEILVQTMNVDAADAIIDLLGDVFSRPRGLPQLLGSSDLLSDTYLAGIERALLRSGYDVYRYADDFKVLTTSWGEANDVIETAADVAREFGLVLSTAKTTIRRAETLLEQRKNLVDFLSKYFKAAREDLTRTDIFPSPYGDLEEVDTEPSDREAYEEAFWRILSEWCQAGTERELPFHSHHIPLALSYLKNANRRIGDEVLRQIVFSRPVHLQAVLGYVAARPEAEANWTSLSALAEMERQSPWAKIWLLDTAQRLPVAGGDSEASTFGWATRQMEERHETVRSSAAWLLAMRGRLSEGQLQALSPSASRISRPLLAASVTAAGLNSKFARSIKNESPLAQHASEWTEKQLS